MTDDFDDLDALASAYLDGEATADEVAQVEADAELLARVDAFRDLSDGIGEPVAAIDGPVRDAHLAAALDAFDSLDLRDEATAPVIDLTQRERRTAAQAPSRPDAESGRGPSGLPRWLGVAAALLLVVGGIGFISQLGLGGDDDDAADTATAAFDSDEGRATSIEADDAAGSEVAEAETVEESADDEAMEETEAFADDAANDGGSDEAAEEDAGEDTSADDEAAAQTTAPSTTTTGGLFPEERIEEARVFLEGPLDQVALDELLATTDALESALSTCGEVFGEENGVEVIGFIPVSVDDVPGEVLLVIEAAGGEPVPVHVDESCVQVP